MFPSQEQQKMPPTSTVAESKWTRAVKSNLYESQVLPQMLLSGIQHGIGGLHQSDQLLTSLFGTSASNQDETFVTSVSTPGNSSSASQKLAPAGVLSGSEHPAFSKDVTKTNLDSVAGSMNPSYLSRRGPTPFLGERDVDNSPQGPGYQQRWLSAQQMKPPQQQQPQKPKTSSFYSQYPVDPDDKAMDNVTFDIADSYQRDQVKYISGFMQHFYDQQNNSTRNSDKYNSDVISRDFIRQQEYEEIAEKVETPVSNVPIDVYNPDDKQLYNDELASMRNGASRTDIYGKKTIFDLPGSSTELGPNLTTFLYPTADYTDMMISVHTNSTYR